MTLLWVVCVFTSSLPPEGVIVSDQLNMLGVVLPVREEPPQLVINLLREIIGVVPTAEIVIVDDSTNEHWLAFERAVLAVFAHTSQVHLIHRDQDSAWGRLAGAVWDGFRKLGTLGVTIAVCMDGDGQHDPAILPSMYAMIAANQAQVVVGSRYIPGGSPGTGLTPARRLMSRGCHLAALTCFPRSTRGCHDSMSGYFAVRLAAIDFVATRVDRFKVLLQMLVQNPRLTIAEVPYVFRPRLEGYSKASMSEAMAYLTSLFKLRLNFW